MDFAISILVITYNQEKYIGEAIASLINQQTVYPFEIIIADDASTDRTGLIIQDWVNKFPDLIKPIFRQKNIGANNNWIDAYKNCKGKYVAFCEGDDYWTDPYKLQKQVGFLEGHPEVVLCFANAMILYEREKAIRNWQIPLTEGYYDGEKLIYDLIVPTCTAVIRKILDQDDLIRLSSENYVMGDMIVWLSLAMKGRIYCLNEKMAVYRKNQASSAFQLSLESQIRLLRQHESIAEDFNGRYKTIEEKFLSRQYLVTGLKCVFKFNRNAVSLLKKAFTLHPYRIPYNILYIIKRLFIKDRSI